MCSLSLSVYLLPLYTHSNVVCVCALCLEVTRGA